LATRQGGVVSTAQLRALGLSDGAIAHRARVGRLHRVHRGVYAVGHVALGREGRIRAALLATGPGAAASHRTAGGVWGIRATARAAIELSSASRGRRGAPGIEVHRVRRLDPRDVTTVDAIAVTTVARTLVDLASVLTPSRLERAVAQADVLELLDVAAVNDVLERTRGRRGTGVLRELLGVEAPHTRSELEHRFLRLVRKAGLPVPAMNVSVAGHDVDAVWFDARLVVELDSWAFHRQRAAFERDRLRDTDLALAGFRTVRLTHRRIAHEPRNVVDMLSKLRAAAAYAPVGTSTVAGQP
jgi:very-short-patch-repair endonuclease